MFEVFYPTEQGGHVGPFQTFEGAVAAAAARCNETTPYMEVHRYGNPFKRVARVTVKGTETEIEWVYD